MIPPRPSSRAYGGQAVPTRRANAFCGSIENDALPLVENVPRSSAIPIVHWLACLSVLFIPACNQAADMPKAALRKATDSTRPYSGAGYGGAAYGGAVYGGGTVAATDALTRTECQDGCAKELAACEAGCKDATCYSACLRVHSACVGKCPKTAYSAIADDHCYVAGQDSHDVMSGEHMYVYNLSLHHGTTPSFMSSDDTLFAADMLNDVVESRIDDSVIVMTSSSCFTGLDYGFGLRTVVPEDEVLRRLDGKVTRAESAPCGTTNRHTIAVGRKFSVEKSWSEDYPDRLKTTAERNGFFLVRHASGQSFLFISVYASCGDCKTAEEKRRHLDQLSYVWARAKKLAESYPVFIGGDVNLTLDGSDDDQVAKDVIRSKSRPTSFGRFVDYDTCSVNGKSYAYKITAAAGPPTSGKIHAAVIQRPGIALLAHMLDPKTEASSLAKGYDASSIKLRGGFYGLTHNMTGAMFRIGGCASDADCTRPETCDLTLGRCYK